MNIIKQIAEIIDNNELESALKLIEEHSSDLEENSEFWNLKGLICIKADEMDIAVDCLERAIHLDSSNYDAIYNLAYVYESSNEYDRAITSYNHLLENISDESIINDINDNINRIKNILMMHETNKDEKILESDHHSKDDSVIVINTDKKTVPQPGESIYSSRSNVMNVMHDDESPLVSIVIVGYNKLEKHTKTCIECVLKYTTDIDYELILVDNGSSDGTLEYFRNVIYSRKRIVRVSKNIGAHYGSNIGLSLAKGQYIVGLPNDIYVTKNWLSNMLKCMMSNERIGMIAPVLDNVSNYQSVDLKYKDFNDMQQKAEEYNISDPKKWEERLRLIGLAILFRRECLDMVGVADYGFFHDFADDDFSFRVRRMGYKIMLCKDTFVSHAGKIADKDQSEFLKSIEEGRKNFKDKYYGLDAWDDVNNFEIPLLSLLNLKKEKVTSNSNVLGVNVLCGTPILEFKNRMRNIGVFDVKLNAFSTDAKYWLDLSAICDGTVDVDRIEYISSYYPKTKFDYIIIGDPINTFKDPYKLLEDVLILLKNEGKLLLKLQNTYDIKVILDLIGQTILEEKTMAYHISIEEFVKAINQKGYENIKLGVEKYILNEATQKCLQGIINTITPRNKDNVFNKVIANNYLVAIGK